MCGIAGFVDQRKTLNRSHVDAMICSVSHRGPDGDGIHFEEHAAFTLGLGHKRLSIIDLSTAAGQPFHSADGRYVMVFNGEIYNFQEVAVQYGIQPRTHSDTEILLEAFIRKGVDCLHDLNGMFAVAIWDKDQQRLTLLRDRFGVKPVVYYQKDGLFAFGSELKALMALPIEKKLNTEALNDYLFLEHVPASTSILQHTHKLPNGHYLTLDRDGMQIRPYYDFFSRIRPRPLATVDETGAIDEFDALLGSAVKYRQVSDVPVGAFLSGGTDSSLICSLFQKQNTQPIQTFTIGFDVADFDETGYASAVAKVLRTNHREFRLTDRESMAIVDKLAQYYDEPFAAPSTIPSYLVCHEARKVVTVAMSGDGGDELFMGYGYYPLYAKLKKIYRVMPALGRQLLGSTFRLLGDRYDRAARTLRLPSDNLFVHLWSEQQYMFSEAEIARLTGRPYRNTSVIREWEEVDRLPLNDYEKISLYDIREYLTHNLLYKMDSASMANSLEVRNPFLDYRLMEFSFNLPTELKIRNGTHKYLMKKLLERYLPHELVYRRKWGFPAPVGNWLLGELAPMIDQWLNPERIRRQGIFDPAEVQRYVKAFRGGKQYHYKRIWSLIGFQMWHEQYFERHGG